MKKAIISYKISNFFVELTNFLANCNIIVYNQTYVIIHWEELNMSKKCPKCEKIFEDDSLTMCPDCNVELEDSEKPKQEVKQVSVFSLTNEESAQGVIQYMKEQGVEGTYQYSLREKTYKIYVAQPDARAALKACTSYYAEEAKRIKAEEEKRRQEEEERLRKEEEERLRREAEEAERIRREEEERLRREEEERLRKEEEERLARELAETKAREEEERRLAVEAAEKKAREAEEKRIFEEQQALLRAAEEAERQAREAEERIKDEERLRKEEEERLKREAAEREALEEENRKKEAAAKRRLLFEAAFQEAEIKKEEELKKDPNYIPHVNAETVQDDFFADIIEETIPEKGPIFVETEPVDEYEVGDTIVVDAVDVEPGEETEAEPVEPAQEDSSSMSDFDFFSNLNKKKNIAFSDEDVSEKAANKNEKASRADFFASLEEEKTETKEPVVEDMFSDNIFRKTEAAKKEAMNSLFEEVIDKDLNKSPKIDLKEAFAKMDSASALSIDDIDDGGYKGFVPDYHQVEEEKIDPDEVLAQSYGFSVDDYKALKERTAQKAKERKANPVKPKKESKDFKIVDDDLKVGDYQGFIPDYASKKGLENMTFYTSSTKIDYSKYKSTNVNDRNNLGDLYATLRSASTTELSKLFESDVVKACATTNDITDLKSSTYLLALTGGQLNSLFNAWLMTNVTSVTVKQFEGGAAIGEDNYTRKIEGIKNLLKQNFGKLDDSILDVIVKTFYNKYLDD